MGQRLPEKPAGILPVQGPLQLASPYAFYNQVIRAAKLAWKGQWVRWLSSGRKCCMAQPWPLGGALGKGVNRSPRGSLLLKRLNFASVSCAHAPPPTNQPWIQPPTFQQPTLTGQLQTPCSVFTPPQPVVSGPPFSAVCLPAKLKEGFPLPLPKDTFFNSLEIQICEVSEKWGLGGLLQGWIHQGALNSQLHHRPNFHRKLFFEFWCIMVSFNYLKSWLHVK